MVQIDPASAQTVFDEPVADVRYGASIAHLADVAAFARELVERGRLLPTVRRDGDGALATLAPGSAGARHRRVERRW